MRVEIVELLRQDVSVRDEVKLVFSESLLHFHVVVAQAVFSRDLITLREVIDALVLIKALIHVALTRRGRPAQVPFVRLSHSECVCLKNRSNQASLTLQDFVKHLVVVDMVPAGSSLVQHWPGYQLLLVNGFDLVHRVACLVVCVRVLLKRTGVLRVALSALKEVLSRTSGSCSVILSRHK